MPIKAPVRAVAISGKGEGNAKKGEGNAKPAAMETKRPTRLRKAAIGLFGHSRRR